MTTYSQVFLHLIWATKNRAPFIKKEFQVRLYQYISGVFRDNNASVIAIGGMDEHIHILICLSLVTPIADLVRIVKSKSSRWINEYQFCRAKFSWQRGYSAFSVSASGVSRVKAYIQNQRAHHHQRKFKNELILLLKKSGIPFDPKYLFE